MHIMNECIKNVFQNSFCLLLIFIFRSCCMLNEMQMKNKKQKPKKAEYFNADTSEETKTHKD